MKAAPFSRGTIPSRRRRTRWDQPLSSSSWTKAFADRTGLRVYLGEFGAIVHADLASRERYTRLVRTEAEKRGLGWAYWDFCQLFAAFTPCGPEGRWIPEIRAALIE